MKIGVIGANGKLGSLIVKEALKRGHAVKAIVYNGDSPDERAELVSKSLFNLTREDLVDIDVLISAYGSGIKGDMSVNEKAYQKYIELLDHSDKKLVAIAGAGTLFTDETHSLHVYESPSHPEVLRELSKYVYFGVCDIKKVLSFDWTVVSPSLMFDSKGKLTGQYLVGENEEVIYNDDGESYVTYLDLAYAMVNIAENDEYNHQSITIATKTMK